MYFILLLKISGNLWTIIYSFSLLINSEKSVMVLLGEFFSIALIAPLHSVEIRVDARVHSFVLCTVQRGFAYGFSFNTHLASQERKTRSRSRKVIFPLAFLDRREPAGIAVSIGRLFNRKPGFSAVYLSVPCTQPYLAEETKEKGRLSCIERGKQLIWHRRRPGIHFVLK